MYKNGIRYFSMHLLETMPGTAASPIINSCNVQKQSNALCVTIAVVLHQDEPR